MVTSEPVATRMKPGDGCNRGGLLHPLPSDGTYIYTSVTVDGYSSGTCPTQPAYMANECHSTTHTPKLYNMIGSTGGWVTGGAVYWTSYVSATNSQQMAARPGNEYTFA